MSTESDQEARRRRAARLRDQINTLVDKTQAGATRRDVPRVEPLSPREFVHQRMRELDLKSKNEQSN